MNKIIVVTAPSGAGKTTIVRHLLTRIEKLSFSVSATTRKKREYETGGKDYHFISEEDFKEKIESHAFLEWEEVYPGNYYGTLRSEVEKIWKADKVAIFDIDVAGAKKIKKAYPVKSLGIFIMPPTLDVLLDRLKNRKTESPEELLTRIDKASFELEAMEEFDIVVVNEDLESAVNEAEKHVLKFLGELTY